MIFTTLLLLSIAQAVAPGQPSNDSSGSRALVPITEAMRQPRPNGPFAKLFTQSSDAADATEQLRHALQAQKEAAEKIAPKRVCGMTVLPADPQIDPKIIRRPANSATTFHIKRIPPDCTE